MRGWPLLGVVLAACAASTVEPPAAPPAVQPPAVPAPAPAASPAQDAAGQGGFRAEVSGCAAAPEAEASRFAIPAGRRGLPPPPAVTAVEGGALLIHPIEHACCLKAQVTARTGGRLAVVLERLTGSPCRCRCASTIRTALSLSPGRWTVAIDLEEGGAVRRVHQQELEVR